MTALYITLILLTCIVLTTFAFKVGIQYERRRLLLAILESKDVTPISSGKIEVADILEEIDLIEKPDLDTLN